MHTFSFSFNVALKGEFDRELMFGYSNWETKARGSIFLGEIMLMKSVSSAVAIPGVGYMTQTEEQNRRRRRQRHQHARRRLCSFVFDLNPKQVIHGNCHLRTQGPLC